MQSSTQAAPERFGRVPPHTEPQHHPRIRSRWLLSDEQLLALLTGPDALPLQRVYRWEKERANRLFLTQPIARKQRHWTWAQAMDEVRRMAAFLKSQQWPPESRIAILSKNCAYWMMAELAIWMSGHVSVPIYPSLTANSVRPLLEHCEPVACFIGGLDDRSVVEAAIPEGTLCIRFPTAAPFEALEWESVVAETQPLAGSPLRGPDELAIIIYTSGTTGKPKGVMHRFGAFGYCVVAGARVFGVRPYERLVSYLPLAHIAERALVEFSALYLGFHVFFIESIETFRNDLKNAHPTIFFSVPRLFLKFQQNVFARIPEARLSRLLRIPVVGRLVGRRILKELGLDAVHTAASGGAPLPLATLEWFRSIGLNLVEGYGMSETGITHTPVGSRSHPGFVGDSVPGVESRIAQNGELLVRSPMNMIGYYKDPEATVQAFTEDGFFHTGDLAEMDADGWIRIVGRVKEQFKTSKGKYVSPVPIEKLLSVHPDIEASCVMGAGIAKPFAIALLTQERRAAVSDPVARAECERSLETLLESVNSELEPHEQLSFLVVTDNPWTIANGLVTPTMKLKRNLLEGRYEQYFNSWMDRQTRIVWHTTGVCETERA